MTPMVLVAAALLPLAHGTFVQTGTPCADPPFAAMRMWDGRGLADPHSRDCRATVRAHRGRTWAIDNDCIGAGAGPAPRDVERLRMTIADPRHFAIGGVRYRLCPAASLPASLRMRN